MKAKSCFFNFGCWKSEWPQNVPLAKYLDKIGIMIILRHDKAAGGSNQRQFAKFVSPTCFIKYLCDCDAPLGEPLLHERDDLVTVTLELGQRHPGQDDPYRLGGDASQLDHPEVLVAGATAAHPLVALLPRVELHVVRVLALVADVLLKYLPPVHTRGPGVFPPHRLLHAPDLLLVLELLGEVEAGAGLTAGPVLADWPHLGLVTARVRAVAEVTRVVWTLGQDTRVLVITPRAAETQEWSYIWVSTVSVWILWMWTLIGVDTRETRELWWFLRGGSVTRCEVT